MKTYWWPAKNFGDTLTPHILEYFIKQKIELAKREDKGKLLAVGSILHLMQDNDVVWGSGLNKKRRITAKKGVRFLAVRGPITRWLIRGAKIPQIYGDPGILLPLIYNPKIEKTCECGVLPHYVDKPFVKLEPWQKLIDIQADWKTVINEVLSCKTIIASSLHGIICAEAYGIPVIWTKYSDKITGGPLKYQDYFMGTGRPRQKYNTQIPPIKDLETKQKILIKALQDYYGKN
jgi:pyruvyltransferase